MNIEMIETEKEDVTFDYLIIKEEYCLQEPTGIITKENVELPDNSHLQQLPACEIETEAIDQDVETISYTITELQQQPPEQEVLPRSLFQCSTCEISFKNQRFLENHRITHGYMGPLFTCAQCGMVFKRKFTLKAHVVTCGSDFTCIICDQVFQRELDLNEHELVCLKNCSSKGVQEKQNESNDPAFTCYMCGEYNFLDETTLQRHSKACRAVSSFITEAREATDNMELLFENRECPACFVSLDTDVNFKNHLLYHVKGTCPFECHICNTSYNYKKDYVRHRDSMSCKTDTTTTAVELISDERLEMITQSTVSCPFSQLNYCFTVRGKQFYAEFPRAENKDDSRTTEMAFKCPYCEKLVLKSSMLREHIQQNHYDRPKFDCTVCGKKFMQKSALAHHRDISIMCKVATKPTCSVCKKSFHSEENLSYHRRNCKGPTSVGIIQVVEISLEDAEKMTNSNYEKYMKKHQPNEHTCNRCGKYFTRKQDKLKHKCQKTARATGHPYREANLGLGSNSSEM